jgi:hypothetical protein
MLAHINPREAEMLKRMGGAGTTNPNTGLREYKGGGSIISAILPIALSFIAPGLGTAIGSAISGGLGLGLGAAATSALGAGIIGAGAGALGGGGLKGALIGGLTSGIGNYALGPAGLGLTGEGGSLSKATDSLGLTGENGLFGSGPSITTGPSGVDYVEAPVGSDAANAASAKLEAQMGGQMSPLTSTAVSQAQGADIPMPTARPTGDALSAIGGDARNASTGVLDSLKSAYKDSGIGSLVKYAPLALAAGRRIAYMNLWPHARPFHIAHPQPALRSIPGAEDVAEILRQAMIAEAQTRLGLVHVAAPEQAASTDQQTAFPSGAVAA